MKANLSNKRAMILEAAGQVIHKHGIAGATTRRIAHRAGCAEGTLYIHFHDRFEIMSALFEKELPAVRKAMANLQGRVGLGDPIDNLADLFAEVEYFLGRVMPLLAGAFSDVSFRQVFGVKWKELGFGPEKFIRSTSEYICREQELGRVNSAVDARYGSEVAIAKLFFWSFRNGLVENAVCRSSRKALKAVSAAILC